MSDRGSWLARDLARAGFDGGSCDSCDSWASGASRGSAVVSVVAGFVDRRVLERVSEDRVSEDRVFVDGDFVDLARRGVVAPACSVLKSGSVVASCAVCASCGGVSEPFAGRAASPFDVRRARVVEVSCWSVELLSVDLLILDCHPLRRGPHVPGAAAGPAARVTGMTWLTTPAHARWLEQETDRLLAFGAPSAVASGGFARLDERGVALDGPAELWITCRMTHVYALGALLGRPGCAPLVDHGLAALRGIFHDDEHGGWFAEVGADGPTDAEKAAYPHAFVVLATASAAAAGRPGARELLGEALAVSERRFWDDAAGMAVESWDPAFTEVDAYRGVNANMHTVEAYLAAADVTGDRVWLDRAVRIVERVVHGFARDNGWRIPEHFDSDWAPDLDYNVDTPAHPFRPYGATIGHWLEWARLTLHARAALTARGDVAPAWMLDDAVALFDAAVAEGWDVDGTPGFVYTVDWAGRPVVRERMHWVVAEGIAAAATLFAATGDPRFDAWYATWWDYAEQHLLDREGGSWWHELGPDNAVSRTVWEGKADLYHAVQATLIPRLPLTPVLAPALAAGLLG